MGLFVFLFIHLTGLRIYRKSYKTYWQHGHIHIYFTCLMFLLENMVMIIKIILNKIMSVAMMNQ